MAGEERLAEGTIASFGPPRLRAAILRNHPKIVFDFTNAEPLLCKFY